MLFQEKLEIASRTEQADTFASWALSFPLISMSQTEGQEEALGQAFSQEKVTAAEEDVSSSISLGEESQRINEEKRKKKDTKKPKLRKSKQGKPAEKKEDKDGWGRWLLSSFWDTREDKEVTGIPLYWRIVRDNKRFRYLWIGQAISFFGDFFNFIATIAVLHRYSDANLAITGNRRPFAIFFRLSHSPVHTLTLSSVQIANSYAHSLASSTVIK